MSSTTLLLVTVAALASGVAVPVYFADLLLNRDLDELFQFGPPMIKTPARADGVGAQVAHDRRAFLRKAALFAGAQLVPNTSAASDLGALNRARDWLNSRPLKPADLSGKVALLDFWTYTCVGWLRRLPYLRTWAQKPGSGNVSTR